MRGEHEVKKMHFIHLGVNVFSTKVLIAVPSLVGNVKMIFTFPTRDGAAILRGHLNHAKV